MSTTQRLKSLLSLVFDTNGPTNTLKTAAWTTLRVVVGLMMIHNGIDKLGDIQGFADAYVTTIGLPFPVFFSYLAAYTELLAAPLLALGLLTRPAAFALTGTMSVAMYHHILVAGFNIPYLELSAIYASCFLFFTVNGPGPLAVDRVISGLLGQGSAQDLSSLESSFQVSEEMYKQAKPAEVEAK